MQGLGFRARVSVSIASGVPGLKALIRIRKLLDLLSGGLRLPSKPDSYDSGPSVCLS